MKHEIITPHSHPVGLKLQKTEIFDEKVSKSLGEKVLKSLLGVSSCLNKHIYNRIKPTAGE